MTNNQRDWCESLKVKSKHKAKILKCGVHLHCESFSAHAVALQINKAVLKHAMGAGAPDLDTRMCSVRNLSCQEDLTQEDLVLCKNSLHEPNLVKEKICMWGHR